MCVVWFSFGPFNKKQWIRRDKSNYTIRFCFFSHRPRIAERTIVELGTRFKQQCTQLYDCTFFVSERSKRKTKKQKTNRGVGSVSTMLCLLLKGLNENQTNSADRRVGSASTMLQLLLERLSENQQTQIVELVGLYGFIVRCWNV